jgi:general secretion pathway protein H
MDGRAPSGRHSRDDGITLVELLVVLAILALVLISSVPALRRPSPEVELRLHALKIVAALNAGRARSQATGFDTAFAIDPQTNTWRLIGGGGHSLIPAGMFLTLKAARVTTRNLRDVQIVFFPDGSAAGGQLSITKGEHRAEITVDWLTGAVAFKRLE